MPHEGTKLCERIIHAGRMLRERMILCKRMMLRERMLPCEGMIYVY